jgi:hypothetical protein
MNLIPRLFPVFLAVFVSVPPASSAQVALQFDGWYLAPSGDGNIGIGGVAGTDFDVEDDLGYGDEEFTPGVTLWMGDRHQFGASYLHLDISADNRIARTLRFEDLDFHIDSAVSSSLEATLIRGAYRFRFGDKAFSAGLIVGGQYVDLSADAASPDVGSARADASAGMPIVGADFVGLPVDWLQLRGGAVGFSWEFDNIEAVYLDVRADAAVRLANHWLLGAGYRHVRIDSVDDSEPVDIDVTFAGPVVFVGVAW